MGPNFNKWWLLPFFILTVSALTALSIIVFQPSFLGSSSDEAPEHLAATGPAAKCSGASANDYACYQKRYQNLVRDSGVEAAFADLKDEFTKEEFVKSNCHQLTHVIGRTAADLYGGDIATTYSRGDNFCASGYYHGAMETIVAKLGPDKILSEADNICAGLREQQNHSLDHRNCVHGLGHGFMEILNNELFEALDSCDTLTEEWERSQCSGGVFMENEMTQVNPNRPSKYLKADQPLYPCAEVKSEYKTQCYGRQTGYALKVTNEPGKTVQEGFAKVFGLCAEVEDGFRTACYSGLGAYAANAARESSTGGTTDGVQAEAAGRLCMLGQDDEALSNCVLGAVSQFVFYYDTDVQAKALCESIVSADFRAECLQASEARMASRQS